MPLSRDMTHQSFTGLQPPLNPQPPPPPPLMYARWLRLSFLMIYKSQFLSADAADGAYSDWSPFSECNASCGGGVKIRKRSCNSPEPKNGGKDCSGLGPAMGTEECNSFPCRTINLLCFCQINILQCLNLVRYLIWWQSLSRRNSNTVKPLF